jgi:hypothetical protein
VRPAQASDRPTPEPRPKHGRDAQARPSLLVAPST